jgi:putative chitinase
VNITLDKLRRVCTPLPASAALFLPYLNSLLPAAGIDTNPRVAAFLAEGAHETMHFARTREIWGPTDQQKRYERDFAHPWIKGDPVNHLAFELGNSAAGDGRRYLGRGIFETTGRDNVLRTSIAIYGDARLLDRPELLEEPDGAVRSAIDFWTRHSLSKLADAGEFDLITRAINGGQNGAAERRDYNRNALTVDWLA